MRQVPTQCHKVVMTELRFKYQSDSKMLILSVWTCLESDSKKENCIIYICCYTAEVSTPSNVMRSNNWVEKYLSLG